ncbi:Clp protease ClpP [Limosilactobacillus reuteri]|uniref:ATP-dependent Clp protease proteolytic subunit n=1 Tax=Limosilactobacillus reuteri TaxID=1598 RepID=A0AAW4X4Q5_LIMRT|nr:head maturation protease, ClpP-related [Limosilactobacillus reuteri]MCC4477389.1 Clp protease ClpP [Limosilactobacillus reuteri]MCC4479666.1 Clp protease ClpP [Limosilactobacillus reuteri]MCC4489028.1 Clp protease ClpP [Limosilactobacillus reuteri]MCC4493273.1 Clp protease ClpP [Limosilactobacillus reuteri]MCC4496055.1 Clp protease ClpP [Limosilactobacillus reuteri]
MNKTVLPKYLTIKQESKNMTPEMYIDGEIVTDEYEDTDTSAAGFRNALKSLGDVKNINLHINSPGGSVFEGIAIYNMLKQNSAHINVYIDGLAASIASVIAMSGDAIFMPSNSMMMVHNPWVMAIGNANELRKQADALDQITKSSVQTYLAKAGDKLDEKTLTQLMDDETWLTAQEAVDYGLADEVMEPNKAVASINKQFVSRYRHVPEQLIKQAEHDDNKLNSEQSLEQEQLNKIHEKALANAKALNISIEKLKEEF